MPESPDKTILFADIEGSASLYEVHGDEAAQAFVVSALGRIATIVADHRGTVVKTIGDEVMATFPDPRSAVHAACEMNRYFDDEPMKLNGTFRRVSLAAGLHHGPVILDGTDVFGDSVNLASRMASMAKGGQILATQEVVGPLPAEDQNAARLIDITRVKGKTEDIRVYDIVWDQGTVTVVVDPSGTQGNMASRMEVRFGEVAVVLDASRPAMSLGRDADSDLVFAGTKTSRRHARIVYRRGHFVLMDESSNGTWLAERGRAPIFLKRDEAVLYDRGRIGLGEAVDDDAVAAVLYELRPAP